MEPPVGRRLGQVATGITPANGVSRTLPAEGRRGTDQGVCLTVARLPLRDLVIIHSEVLRINLATHWRRVTILGRALWTWSRDRVWPHLM